MIKIVPIDLMDKKQKKLFVDYDYEIYRDNPYWVAPLRMDIEERLNPKKHPFYQNASIQAFLAYRNDKIVGRIAAINNEKYNEFHNSKVGFFGFFECINDVEVARELIHAAKQWNKNNGVEIMQGPVNPSTNYESGLLTKGFEDPPRLMMAYNPEYYKDILLQAGLNTKMTMFAYKMEKDKVYNDPKLTRIKDIALKRAKIKIRNLDKKNLENEIVQIKKIYNIAWENNWGFVPMSDREFDKLANELKLIVDEDLVPILENEAGEIIGFGISLRDINQIIQSFNGKLFPFNFLKLFYQKKKMTWIRVILLGILPQYHGKGLDASLYTHIIEAALKRNINLAEASWILETNEAMNAGLKVVSGEIYKTYEIFETPID
ncbi:MAG: hypothetical protein MUE53_00215 [Chitinophagales bacterium]|jgi:GNAT superfamily N-acetyltransferase|nr:hypothetical protein [Chitinophagales bacterium]